MRLFKEKGRVVNLKKHNELRGFSRGPLSLVCHSLQVWHTMVTTSPARRKIAILLQNNGDSESAVVKRIKILPIKGRSLGSGIISVQTTDVRTAILAQRRRNCHHSQGSNI